MNHNLLVFLFMSFLGSATSLRLQKIKEVAKPTLEFADYESSEDGLKPTGKLGMNPETGHRKLCEDTSTLNLQARPGYRVPCKEPGVEYWKSMGPVHKEGVPKCMLSQHGIDGFGHQLFAKLSCMAVAEDLGMKYVHTGFDVMEHGEVGSSYNDYLGLDKVYPNVESIPNFVERARSPVAFVGHCDRPSYLKRLASGEQQCAHDGVSVYTGDNCWDYFFCEGQWSDHWYKLQPRVREAFLESSKAHSVDMEKRGPNDKRVVLHIRQGDAAKMRGLNVQYYHNVIDMLKKEFEEDGKNATFHIETDGKAEDFKKFVDKGVTIEDRTSSMKRAFRSMVTADVFVASKSSLSMSAALLSLGQVIWPECDEQVVNRPPTWRNQTCV